ncbi:hypothetical protein [Massilia orientalis]|uniref:Uncharacterized protein n=1 Tax=Massilia orientalis TaxID=3050128 RepID=A0ACC7ME64_9BURK|nr:hypothetical protein [Massilia sp. YIM B02787]
MNGGPVISIEQLRQAVESYREAHGLFPIADDGQALPGLTWRTIDRRLRDGHRGLPGATSLRKWLDENYQAERYVAPYSSASMRAWVVTHREANGGAFPHVASGEILGANRTWMDVNDALRKRQLAFTKSGSLSSWLDDQFPLDRKKKATLLTADLIISLVEAYRAEHDGSFPYRESGKVAGLNMTWTQLDNALRQGGKSLAKWLGRRYPDYVEVSEQRLRAWVDEYACANARALPSLASGEIAGTGWTWTQVDRAFRRGEWRWAPADSLSAWLDATFPAERILTPANVRMWVENHVTLHGSFPTKESTTPVAPESAWTWPRINSAMIAGSYSWREKATLAAWLDRQYPECRILAPANLHAWVSGHAAAHGDHPTRHSLEPAAYGAHWNWFEIDKALRRETGGWQGRTTLSEWIGANVQPIEDDLQAADMPSPA